MTDGAVIWITGLSGAGKTTVGRLVTAALTSQGRSVVFLDGDELRTVFAGGERYDREGRLALALSYGRLCRLLALQGQTVVCATISMRHEVYDWNRAHLPRYFEVFLDVSAALRGTRDPKSLYAAAATGALRELAGHDQSVDYPSAPHLHLRPDALQNPEETASEVMSAFSAAFGIESCDHQAG
jgi:adenylylsulfate kinase